MKSVSVNSGNINSKMHNAGVRVLTLLKLLIENDISIKDIMKNTRQNFDDIEAPETILKYLSTIEFSGFDIKKINKKYSLCNSPSRLDFSAEERHLLEIIYKSFKDYCLESERKDFDEIFAKLNKFVTPFLECKNLYDNEKDVLSQKAQYYQNYVDLAQKLKIKYLGFQYSVEAKSVEIENGKIYLNVYCFSKMSMMRFLTDDIEMIEVLPLKVNNITITNSVVFEVYGGLVGNYRLRDCEKVQSFSDSVKVIVNSGEDKDLLLKRLMKYGENCKIISPKSFQMDFIQKIHKMKETGIKR
ncbi:MAG: hypothetical protein ACI37Z_02975 [Candidatus Gastranaerophilaceae bacterium]